MIRYDSSVTKAYQEIASYKWKDGTLYCRVCKETVECRQGKYPHSRKCTICDTDYSPTANTVLHGIRFPVGIALFIVQEVMFNKGRMRLAELKTKILFKFKRDIRLNTISNFLIKIYNLLLQCTPQFKGGLTILIIDYNSHVIIVGSGFIKTKCSYYAVVTTKDRNAALLEFVKLHVPTDVKVSAHIVGFKRRVKTSYGKRAWETDIEISPMAVRNRENTDSYDITGLAEELRLAITGVRPQHFQAYLNLLCFFKNFGTYNDVMSLITRTTQP